MTRYFFIALLAFVTVNTYGQLKGDTSRTTINMVCDRFMQDFKEGKYSDGIQLLKQNSIMGNSFLDNLDQTVNNQLKNIETNYHKIVGYELIEEKSVKNIVVRRRYLLKFELYFLTFDFYLYNNGSSWTISGFYYKDEQKELF
jgi:hypothetical protein